MGVQTAHDPFWVHPLPLRENRHRTFFYASIICVGVQHTSEAHRLAPGVILARGLLSPPPPRCTAKSGLHDQYKLTYVRYLQIHWPQLMSLITLGSCHAPWHARAAPSPPDEATLVEVGLAETIKKNSFIHTNQGLVFKSNAPRWPHAEFWKLVKKAGDRSSVTITILLSTTYGEKSLRGITWRYINTWHKVSFLQPCNKAPLHSNCFHITVSLTRT